MAKENSIETKQAIISTPTIEPVKQSPTPPTNSSESDTASYGVTLSSMKSLKEIAKQKLMALSNKVIKKEITQENLNESWLEVVEKVAGAKAVYKSAILESDLSFNHADITIHATIVGFDYLKGERITLLDFFKTYYNNDEVNVLFALKEIQESTSEGGAVLSTREVFEKMALKNPLLRYLKDNMGMDFEY